MKHFFPWIAVFFLAGCATVPMTGRKQLSFIPQGQLLTLSDQSYQEILGSVTLSRDAAKTAELVEVGRRSFIGGRSFYERKRDGEGHCQLPVGIQAGTR